MITINPDYDARTVLTGERLTAFLGLPFRYSDRKPGASTDFTTENLAKAITFGAAPDYPGKQITFFDTTIEGLVAIDTLINRLHVRYAARDPQYAGAKELAKVIHTIATEAYEGFDDLIADYYERQDHVDEEESGDEE